MWLANQSIIKPSAWFVSQKEKLVGHRGYYAKNETEARQLAADLNELEERRRRDQEPTDPPETLMSPLGPVLIPLA